jgi:hypothetical protein
MTRAMFLATAALLAMLILAPMAMGQGTTVLGGGTTFFSGGGGGGGPSASGSAPVRYNRGVGVGFRLRRLVALPSFCLRPCCCSGRAS